MLPEFKIYQQQVLSNAKYFAEKMLARGFNIVSGGTDNHLFLLNLVDKNLTGKRADQVLGQAHITVNKNTVPNDPQSPMITSGIRIGTPAITTRGFKQPEIDLLNNWICDLLTDIDNQTVINRVKNEVLELCSRFPVYGRQ